MDASIFQVAAQGFYNILDPYVLLAVLVGVGIGTFNAVAPQGMGTPLAYSILLPVVVRWEPVTAIALLLGISAVSAICAAYLPILFGIPGGAGSVATILDGYPMGQRGEARRALGASFMAGGMGSLIGTFTLILAVPVAKPLIHLMGSPELFVLVLWGLSMVSILSGRQPVKGLIAAALGLLIASIGQQPQSGILRFVFGQVYLLDGFSISIIAVALFGIPSALELALAKMGVEQQPAPLNGSLLDGVKDTLREWWLVVRCSFVGVWVGIVPGIGSQTVDWLAYGHAVQTCKGSKEMFGKGDVRGVIAPECANDAKDGGDLITTLLLGLPQGATTALFLVALLALRIIPGPDMVKNHLDIIFSAIWLQGIAGILGTLIGFCLANQLAKLANIRYSLMVPIILSFILLGALTANRDPLDLLTVACFGALGFFMKRFGYPRPALILGLILGGLMEKYLYRSVASYGISWLLRPGVMVLLVLAVVTLLLSLPRKEKKESPDDSPVQGTAQEKKIALRIRPDTVFTLFSLCLFLTAIAVGLQWPLIAKLLPIYLAAIPGVLMALTQIFSEMKGRPGAAEAARSKKEDQDAILENGLDFATEVKRTLVFCGWFFGGAVAVWLLGIVIALPLLLFSYSLIEGREKWWVSMVTAAGGVVFVWGVFEFVMDVQWPGGALFQ
ncbi:MAG: tripartite tricarboxylate transporter permease [Desulfobacterales bacterium]|nr:tripartite tricarboxylate transporter permease [Desulfobacterales bacterium]